MTNLLVLRQCAYECDTYGSDVVAAFGEYCGHRARIVRRMPRLKTNLETLRFMVLWLMDYDSLERA